MSDMTELSHEKLQQVITIAKKTPASEELYKFYSNAYHEMAYYETSKNEYSKAISYLQQSNSYLQRMNNASTDFLLASNYQYTGTLFNSMKQADSAIFYFNHSLRLTNTNKDITTKTLQNYTYTNMGHSYLLKNNLKKAKENFTKVLNDAPQFRTIDLNQDLYNNLITYYENIKDIDSITIYKNKLDSVNAIIYKTNSETVNSITQQLNKENKLLKESRHFNNWYFIAIACSVFTAGAFWISKKKYRKAPPLVLKNDTKPDELNIAKDTEQRLMEQIKKFEEEKQYLDPTIPTTLMANTFKTNTKYITHVLKKMYDKDFTTYINTLRINYIIDLLEKEPVYREYKISYLAKISGYSSHSKFTAVFKKIKGYSPSEFITQLEKDQ